MHPITPETPVRALMSTPVLVAREEMTMAELARLLVGNEVEGVPVVDRAGRPVGFVSHRDMTAMTRAHDLGGKPSSRKVKEVMSPTVYSVEADASLTEAAKRMRTSHVHRLVVMEQGHVVGIISSFDLLRVLSAKSAA